MWGAAHVYKRTNTEENNKRGNKKNEIKAGKGAERQTDLTASESNPFKWADKAAGECVHEMHITVQQLKCFSPRLQSTQV